MKKCPFCKARIQDNARFCLYCMKPLGEKEVIQQAKKKTPWWPLATVGALLLVVLALVFLIPKKPGETAHTQSASSTQPAESTGETSRPEDTLPEDPHPSTGTANTNQTPDDLPPNPNGQDVTPKPSENEKPSTTPTASTQPETTPQTETTVPAEATQEATEPEEPKVQTAYTYRAARTGDDFYANYVNSGNDIVITGIAQQAPSGIYDIPAYIDGKKVIAIVANAFTGSNATVVYVPATIKSIWNYAFAGCALTDVYFRGSAIYVESKAFGSALTIHCAATCSDRNLRYYKDCADRYGATWEEWNG